MPEIQAPASTSGIPVRKIISKVVTVTIVALIFGWVYGWASPHMFPKDKQHGFGYGMVHGALMPMALPSLVMGQQVEIFSPNNPGRLYKIGYIVGINVCGLIFFGSAFWRPKKKQP
jgi:hypothetical protein